MQTPQLQPPPSTREDLLRLAGPQRAEIHALVRETLDLLEEAAPWENLYYPPTDLGAFLKIYASMQKAIESSRARFDDLPRRFLISAITQSLVDLPAEIMGESTKQIISALLDASSESDNALTRQVVIDSLDRVPPDAMDPKLREIARGILIHPIADLDDDAVMRTLQELPKGTIDSFALETLDSAYFFFANIFDQARPDLSKLAAKLAPIRDSGQASADERAVICEIAADLKGKYTSSLMGAAAGLIADGLWDGAEIEPLLFDEKAEEWERNERLVETLQEILDSIGKLMEEVPLPDLVRDWQRGRRVDRYSLSPLYSFLGDVGKLMKVRSRRALYSGDYHQIQTRESILSTRVNELNTLHNMTWDIGVPEGFDTAECYPRMVVKALELAVVLHGEVAKKILGEKIIHQLQAVVTRDSERRKAESLERAPGEIVEIPEDLSKDVPENLRSLIPLLYDEDLRTFLELLLGSVLKRSSFSVLRRKEDREQKARDAAAHSQPSAPTVDAPTVDAPTVDAPPVDAPTPARGPIFPDQPEMLDVDPALLEENGLGAPPRPEDVHFDDLDSAFSSAGFGDDDPESLVTFDDDPVGDVTFDEDDAAAGPVEFGANDAPTPFELSPEALEGIDFGGDFGGESDDDARNDVPAPAAQRSDGELLPSIDFGGALSMDDALSVPDGPSRDEIEARLDALEELRRLLDDLVSPTHPNRKSFDLVHRFLKRGNRVPPSMLLSTTPYLEDLVNKLVPMLGRVASREVDVPEDFKKLPEYCMAISTSRNPEDIRVRVPDNMKRVDHLLTALTSATAHWIGESRSLLDQL